MCLIQHLTQSHKVHDVFFQSNVVNLFILPSCALKKSRLWTEIDTYSWKCETGSLYNKIVHL